MSGKRSKKPTIAIPLAPHAIPTEKLLEGLEGLSESPIEASESYVEEDYKNDVLAFISAYNILPGKHEVNRSVIYYLYTKWSKNKVNRDEFIRELNKFYKLAISKGKYYYFIDQDAFSLTKKAYKIVKSKIKDPTKSTRTKQHFENFLNNFDIKPGTFFIEGYVLFFGLYDPWTASINKKNPLGYNRFFQLLQFYFKMKLTKKTEMQFFGIDEKGLLKHISNRQINRIRKARQMYVKRIVKRRNERQKIQAKTLPSNKI